VLDSKFVNWFSANISLYIDISSSQNNVNVCQVNIVAKIKVQKASRLLKNQQQKLQM